MTYRLIFSIFMFLAVFFAVSAPPAVFAVDPPCQDFEVSTEFGCFDTSNPVGFATKMYGIGLGLIGGVGLLSIIYGGYLVLTSQGDQSQLRKGKSFIVSAIVGIVLAVSGFALYQIVAADVLQIPGFK